MVVTLVVLVVNIGGNLIFVPRYGLTAAGIVWGASIVVAAVMHTYQTNWSMGLRTIGRPAFVGVAIAALTVGVVGVTARLVSGDDLAGLLATCSIGGVLYGAGLWIFRSPMHLDSWWSGIRRRSTPVPDDAAMASRGSVK